MYCGYCANGVQELKIQERLAALFFIEVTVRNVKQRITNNCLKQKINIRWCYMKKKVILVLISILIVMLLGIRLVHLANLSESSTIAMNHLKDEGLFILYHKGEYGPYSLTKNDIKDKPYSDYLSVQSLDAEFYTDKELHHEFFYVNNHSLSNVFGLGSIFVTVIMNDEEVVGAFSVKNGMVYSLLAEE